MKCSANNKDKSTIAETNNFCIKWDHFTVGSYV